MLFELAASQMSLSRNITFTFPPDVVEGSERVSLTVVGMETCCLALIMMKFMHTHEKTLIHSLFIHSTKS